jgi:hypothetical protein
LQNVNSRKKIHILPVLSVELSDIKVKAKGTMKGVGKAHPSVKINSSHHVDDRNHFSVVQQLDYNVKKAEFKSTFIISGPNRPTEKVELSPLDAVKLLSVG